MQAVSHRLPNLGHVMQSKIFKLDKSEILPLAEGHGACFATDRITVEGHPVRFMYREESDNDLDSGWRFMSGVNEDDDYMDDPNNIDIYDVNTIANYDRSIIPYLGSPIRSCFEKMPGEEEFIQVDEAFPNPQE